MEPTINLKHKEWRKIAKKFRRKRIRQALAKARDEDEEKLQQRLQEDPKYIVWQTEQKALELFKQQEEERIREEENKKWIENELQAQKLWKEQQEKLKAAKEIQEKQQLLIRKEWEEQQKKLKEEKELKLKLLKEQEEKLKIFNEKIENFIEEGGEIPAELQISRDTNPLKPICPFFAKIGACRFGDTCSRNHKSPGISKVILIRNFYTHFGIDKCFQSEYGNDMTLEFDHKETYEHFKEFFFDTIAEFKKCGRVVQYKVCCNTEPHLRGNVYVEYERTRDALKAYRQFQGRWYGGKRINVEFSGVTSWKKAICGMYFKKLCHKGSACNFLHVFKNPGNLFYSADKDLHRSQELDEHKNKLVDNINLDENFDDEESCRRNWRWSESPEPSTSTLKNDMIEDEGSSKSSSIKHKHKSHTSESERSSVRSSYSTSSHYERKRKREKDYSYSERSHRKRDHYKADDTSLYKDNSRVKRKRKRSHD